ncbi:type II secretion system ATPase GspE [Henriciella algicola]|uniref:Type II secretion system protein E n=1 Tax=Henriciella algicola TaxID=1608422 RepID=A0A399RCE8_9PROT|nr:type II secretion system ATPase GspE [Henriciella algicola]RIJ29118.1 type II secretion system protein GspE [Henriciella algicola]
MSDTSTETRSLTYAFAKDKGLVVMGEEDGAISLGVRAGADPMAIIEARRALGRPLRFTSLDAGRFERELSEAYARSAIENEEADAMDSHGDLHSLIDDIPQTADLLDGDDDAPVVRLINGLIYEAVKRRASDVHIEPHEDNLSVRYRIDGVLQEVLTPSRKLAAPLTSRVKVMARLDIAEKRIPQDGRISLSIGGRSIDVRVSTLPSRYGERVTMRLLDTRNALLGLDELGMDPETLARFRTVLAQPNGITLVTGPTGSGKTSTLYSALSVLNNGQRNVMTLEDPIEYGLEGISQTQMHHKVGLTFAATLRAILRHDPDVVMVGEVRDLETAKVAFEFSSTGRPVLSTVHTNSSVGAIQRLRDMGIEPYVLAATMRAVLAQRLVRKLCDTCKTPHEATPEEKAMFAIPADEAHTFYRPSGCMACAQTGYQGRLGVYELLLVDQEMRRLIREDVSEDELEARAFADHDTLFRNAARYVTTGQTSVEEVLRVCRKDEDA